jgi:hypothetical protein
MASVRPTQCRKAFRPDLSPASGNKRPLPSPQAGASAHSLLRKREQTPTPFSASGSKRPLPSPASGSKRPLPSPQAGASAHTLLPQAGANAHSLLPQAGEGARRADEGAPDKPHSRSHLSPPGTTNPQPSPSLGHCRPPTPNATPCNVNDGEKSATGAEKSAVIEAKSLARDLKSLNDELKSPIGAPKRGIAQAKSRNGRAKSPDAEPKSLKRGAKSPSAGANSRMRGIEKPTTGPGTAHATPRRSAKRTRAIPAIKRTCTHTTQRRPCGIGRQPTGSPATWLVLHRRRWRPSAIAPAAATGGPPGCVCVCACKRSVWFRCC